MDDVSSPTSGIYHAMWHSALKFKVVELKKYKIALQFTVIISPVDLTHTARRDCAIPLPRHFNLSQFKIPTVFSLLLLCTE
jgi:hypothetical protein